MLLTTLLKDWNEHLCFFTNLDSIDSEAVKVHVMWKMSGDPNYVIKLKVKYNQLAKTFEQLNLHDWKFL